MSGSATSLAFVALGANIGEPEAQLREALALLDAAPFGRVEAVSPLYRSAPVGLLEQPDFVNAVAALRTSLAPLELMRALLELETRLGRVRAERNGPRRIDLDLVAYDGRRIELPELQLPHPRLAGRAFVLLPWRDIAPDFHVPGLATVAELARRLPPSEIHRLEA